MASFKDTFEPNSFEANTFAAGVWRGGAVASFIAMVAEDLTLPGMDSHDIADSALDGSNMDVSGFGSTVTLATSALFNSNLDVPGLSGHDWKDTQGG